MKAALCFTCRYWTGRPDWVNGECRRHAPHARFKWPVSRPEEWCGQYEPNRMMAGRAPADIVQPFPPEVSDK